MALHYAEHVEQVVDVERDRDLVSLTRHFHLFDTRGLQRLVEAAGLVQVAQKPLVCPQFWIISVQNWLKERGAERFAERVVSPFNPLLLAPVTVLEILHQRFWWTSNQQLVARPAG